MVPGSDTCEEIRISYPEEIGGCAVGDTKTAIHLHAFLSREVNEVTKLKLALNRKERFGVAAALTWAVLYLCDSPWLEKIMEVKDIHLFLEQAQGSSLHISEHPYLSYNFQRTGRNQRQELQGDTKIGGFQSGQIQHMTLYSLAIRLIELGLNKPFERLRNEYRASTNSSIPGDADATLTEDFIIAKNQFVELELDPGYSYACAVDRCLSFMFPGPPDRNTFEYGPFREAFFADVVAPVQAVFDLIPGSASQLNLY